MKITIDRDAFWGRDGNTVWTRGRWPAHWVSVEDAPEPPYVAMFRLRFSLEAAVKIRFHVSGDERYTLSIDNIRVGRGPERGAPGHWYYETYDFEFSAGSHLLLARVDALGPFAPAAQMSLRPGFIFAPDEEPWLHLIGTGLAPWEARLIPGYTWQPYFWGQYAGVKTLIDGSVVPWDALNGEGEGWRRVKKCPEGQNAARNGESAIVQSMVPAVLPAMYEAPVKDGRVRAVAAVSAAESDQTPYREFSTDETAASDWQRLLEGKAPLTLAPGTHVRALIDLDNYYCFYPTLEVRGGTDSRVELASIEALFNEPSQTEGYASGSKGNRSLIEGKFFRGLGCVIKPDGTARHYEMSDWLAGRYVQVLVTVGAAPLEITGIHFRETRYPLEMTARFSSDSNVLDPIVPLMVRSLQMCTHETYMDCPYYEQLMYVGDSRLEALVTYAISGDERMPRKAIELFNCSRSSNGLTWSRYPCNCPQWIPTFSLLWVAMISDFARWRDDADFVRQHLPGARNVLDTFLLGLNPDGLITSPQGWNFVDWVPGWRPGGMPPGADLGVNGTVNWLLVMVLQQAADLETHFGEAELASRWQRHAENITHQLDQFFWNEVRGLYAEDLGHTCFSEHAQCLALLSGLLNREKKDRLATTLFSDPDLERTTIYFTHYLFEACALTDRIDVLFERMKLWADLPQQGFKTTPENPEPSRSDCHAWGAHPLYHYFASILGIRPSAPGFREVTIRPQLGPLNHAEGVLPTPQGNINVSFTIINDKIRADIHLPKNMSGSLIGSKSSHSLMPGSQTLFFR